MRIICYGQCRDEGGSGMAKAPAEMKSSASKAEWKKPKDWAYMEQSGKVLRNLPDTWKAYAQDEAGRMAIVKMEYGELLNAKTPEEISHELVHLGSATLHLWRLMNDAE